MKKIGRFMLVLLLAGSILAFFSLWDSAAAEQESRLDEVVKRGYVIVGVTTTSPPYGFLDENKKLVGFDIDIAKLIAKGLFGDETKIKFEPLSFSARWAAVQTGKVDFGIMTTTIYPGRIMKVDFTRPYDFYAITVLVRKDSGINSLKDMNDPKYTIANLTNPQMVDRIKRYFPKINVLTVESSSAQYLAVSTGRAHALQHNSMLCAYYAKKNPDLKVLDEVISDWESHGVFLRKGDFAWWNTLDQLMGQVTAGSFYQDYVEVFEKWFGVKPPSQFWWIGKGYFMPGR